MSLTANLAKKLSVKVLNPEKLPAVNFARMRYNYLVDIVSFTDDEVKDIVKLVEPVVAQYMNKLSDLIAKAKHSETSIEIRRQFRRILNSIKRDVANTLKVHDIKFSDVDVYCYYIDEDLIFDKYVNNCIEERSLFCNEIITCMNKPENCADSYVFKLDKYADERGIAKAEYLRIVIRRCEYDSYTFVEACAKLVFTARIKPEESD
jgi:hypothetical protein